MSTEELKLRYKNSPDMFVESEGTDDKPAEPESKLGKLMKYIRTHPDIRNLKNTSATMLNAPAIKEQVKKVRLHMLKQIAGTREHDLTEQELEWASQVLALRIDHASSVKELLDEIEVDACMKDFDRVSYDVRRARAGIARNEELADRYPSQVRTEAPSPEQYLGLADQVNQTVPEVDLGDIGEE